MYSDILENVGCTPMVNIKSDRLCNINLFAKLEYYNPTGSIKDRAADYLIKKLLHTGEINSDTIIIESSSGNFGIALSAFCKKYGLRFYCVVDPNITPANEAIIKELSYSLIKVTEPDSNGGYLLNRLKKVKEFLNETPNSYWINQYGNPDNAEAYYTTLGCEVCEELEKIDYVFVGVSSGGTITGLSKRVKEKYPESKIIAVDVEGSVIFGGAPRKRYIPGMGSSIVPDILKQSIIDEVVIVDELSTVKMCHELLHQHFLFAGGSSGSVFAAVNKYFSGRELESRPNVLLILADRGDRYSSTIYNNEWVDKFIVKSSEKPEKIL